MKLFSALDLGVQFRNARLPAGLYAKNDNEHFRRHFTPLEQGQIHDMLEPFYKDIGFFYEIARGENLLTVLHRPPVQETDIKGCPGILWLAKTGKRDEAPVYQVNYGLGREGANTLNFAKALQWGRLHLENTFSGVLKPNTLNL